MTDDIRRMGPRAGLPAGRHHKVWLAEVEAELLRLAADVRHWREREDLGEGSLSREVGMRSIAGLSRDLAAWAEDETLPAELRERARALRAATEADIARVKGEEARRKLHLRLRAVSDRGRWVWPPTKRWPP